MIIVDEHNKPIIIDTLLPPIPRDFFWTLDLKMMDFTLSELTMFEELTTASVTIKVMGNTIEIPARWYVLVFSEETSQLDCIEASRIMTASFRPVILEVDRHRIVGDVMAIIDYKPNTKLHTPSLKRHQMLCHALGPDHWMCVAPTDSYNKFMKEKLIGDLV